MILKNSRYEGVEFTGIRGPDGIVRKFLHQREPMTAEDVTEEDIIVHVFEMGEELDSLAFNVVKKPLLWWLLADVNNVMFPLASTIEGYRGPCTPADLDPGQDLIMPMRELRDRKEP